MQDGSTEVNPFYALVVEKIRYHRKAAGMDQETFARHLGLSRTTIINIEKGRQRISLEQAWKASQVLGIAITDLLPSSSSDSMEDWEKKVHGNDKIGSDEQKKGVIRFITSLRTNI